MCIYTHIHTHILSLSHTHTHIHIHAYTCMYMCLYINTHGRTVRTFINTRTRTHTHAHTHTHKHTNTHTQTHTHTHTHAHIHTGDRRLKQMMDFQKLNHFPGTFCIGRKDRLTRCLSRFRRRVGAGEYINNYTCTCIYTCECECRDTYTCVCKPPPLRDLTVDLIFLKICIYVWFQSIVTFTRERICCHRDTRIGKMISIAERAFGFTSRALLHAVLVSK